MLQHLRWHRAAAFLGVASLLVLAAGCGDDTPTDSFTGFGADAPEMSIDLAAVDGGTTSAAEAPSFGDPYFANYLGDGIDAVVLDPLAADPALATIESRPEAKVMFLRVVWGNMERGPEAPEFDTSTDRLDWSGSTSVSDGFLIPLRTLAFERGDFIVPPWREQNPSRQRVEFVSHTGPGKDGILFKIVVPSARDTTLSRLGGNGDGLTEDDLFTFSTGPLTLSFPLAAVANLDSVVMVDDRNGVSFLGFDREDLDDMCLRGTMEGAWVRVDGDDRLGGYFRARWVAPLGNTIGHLRGRWGILDGERVFVGKLIRHDGAFLGHVRGHWDPSLDHPGRGSYYGGWMIEGRAHGGLRGRWAVSDRMEQGGFLRGVWKRFCERDGTTL